MTFGYSRYQNKFPDEGGELARLAAYKRDASGLRPLLLLRRIRFEKLQK